jgi:hypothetical protein
MISDDQDANLALVQRRRINGDFLRLDANAPLASAESAHVRVYRLAPSTPYVPRQDELTLRPPSLGGTTVKPENEKEPTLQRDGDLTLQKPAPHDYTLKTPREYQQVKLNDEFKVQ